MCGCYLLAQGHAATQSTREADDFGHKRFEGEIFLQYHPSQDGLHLGNTRTCRREQEGLTADCQPHNKLTLVFYNCKNLYPDKQELN